VSNEADSFLFGGGGKSASFDTIGTTHTGTIIEPPRVENQTDIKTGEVKTFDNGDPRRQMVVVLQTDERDPSVEDDDGVRRLYVKGSPKPESQSMTAAIGAAVKAAKANGLEVGGKLTVTYIGDGPQTERGLSAPKQYAAAYVPPWVGASAQFLAEPAPAAAPVAQAAPAQSTAPAAPAPAAANPVDIAKAILAASGSITDAANASGLPENVVVAIANTV